MDWAYRDPQTYFDFTQKPPDGQRKKRYQGKGMRGDRELIRWQKVTSDQNSLKREMELYRDVDGIVNEFDRAVCELAEATLFLAGFHNPQGRGWKSMRKKVQKRPVELRQHPSAVPDMARFSELVAAVRQGDQKVLPELQAMLCKYPDLVSKYRKFGLKCQMIWAHMVTAEEYVRRRLLAKVGGHKDKLKALGHGTELEDLLIDLVATTWLQIHHFEVQVATDRAPSYKIAKHRERRLKSIIKQHFKAFDLLAVLRKNIQPI